MACEEDEDCSINSIFKNSGGLCEAGVCICNDGFDGIDSFQDFEICHIDSNIRTKIRTTVLVFSILAITVSSLAILCLAREEGSWFRKCFSSSTTETKERKKERKASDVQTQLTGMDIDEDDENEIEGDGQRDKEFSKRRTRVKKNKPESSFYAANETGEPQKQTVMLKKKVVAANLRLTILCVAFLVIALMLFSLYMSLEFVGESKSRATGNAGTKITSSLATGGTFGACFLLSDFYYSALPNLRLYGKLIKGFDVLTRNPNLYHYLCDLFGFLCFIGPLLFGAILPLLDPDNSITYDRLFFLTVAFLGICNVIMTVYVLRFVFVAYSLALKNLNDFRTRFETQLEDLKEQDELRLESVERPISLFDDNENDVSVKDQMKKVNEKIEDISPKVAEIKYVQKVTNFVTVVLVLFYFPVSVFLIFLATVDFLRFNLFLFYGALEVSSTIFILCVSSMIIYRTVTEGNK